MATGPYGIDPKVPHPFRAFCEMGGVMETIRALLKTRSSLPRRRGEA